MEENRQLVQQARNGDKDAFSKLYGQIYKDLYRFALYTLRNQHDAEDAVSEAVMAAYEQIKNLRQEDAFSGWVFKILSNICKQKLKAYMDKTAQLPEELKGNEGNLAEDAQVRAAFWALTEEERLILSMHVFAGYTGKEIGQILDMNENTVRSKESRALNKMKEIMAE